MRRLLPPAVLASFAALVSPAAAVSPDLVVAEVYGGGGNAGAPLTRDYVELFNRGTSPARLDGLSVQYASATGTGSFGATTTQRAELPAESLAPGESLLIQGAGAPPPAADVADSTPIDLSATNGKVALVRGAEPLGCNGGSSPCTAEQLARIVDLVGYGTASFFEGAAAAPTASNTTAPTRAAGGCQDTDQNAADFTSVSPTPRGRAAGTSPCGGAPADTAPALTSSTPEARAADVAPDATIALAFSEEVTLDAAGPALTCGDGAPIAVATSGGPQTFTLTPDGSLPAGTACTLTIPAAAIRDTDADDPPDAPTADVRISFTTRGAALRIHDIQGAAHRSPVEGTIVSGVPGVVTAVRGNGFYFQDAQPDADERTSEGLLVFTGGAPAVTPGQAVLVSGRVTEFRPGGTAGADNLTTTELTSPRVVTAGTGTITPTTVGFGGRIPPLRVIANDGDPEAPGTPFDPRQDGLDFHESLEGMLTQVRNAIATGPTNGFGELPVVSDLGFLAFPRTFRGGVLVRPDDFNPERLILDDDLARPMPLADVRDRFETIRAVVDYSFGNFKYLALAPPERIDGGLTPETTPPPGPDRLATASMNVENLDGADPQAKYDRLARILVDALRGPDLVALEEIQDDDGGATGGSSDASVTWTRFIAAIAAAGGPAYRYRQIDPVPGQDGGEPGGNIRVGFLFRTDRGLSFVDRPGGTATTPTAEDGAAPGAQLTLSPGRIDPTNPAFANSRKPLAGEFRWRGRRLIAIANHFNSKGGDDPLFGRTQPPVRSSEPQRHAQATIVRDFVRTLVAAERDAAVVVLGDFNDFEFSRTLEILEDGGLLANLMETLPVPERYSYVFEGNAQTLDQILVTRSIAGRTPLYDSVHVNAEFADQASDHDPQAARLIVR